MALLTLALKKLQPTWHFLRQLPVFFYIAVLAAVVLIGFNENGYQETRQALDAVKRLDEQRRAIDNVRQLVLNAEASQRGFLLTGRSVYLQPYLQASASMDDALGKVRHFYEASPAGLSSYTTLANAVQRRMAEMEVAVKLRQAAPDQGNWIATINTDVGKQSMDDIHAALELLTQTNRQQIATASTHIHNSVAFSRLAITLTALAALLALYLFLRQQQAAHQLQAKQQALLAAERDQLEAMVRDRTRRMTELANHLLNVQEDERARLARELHDEMGALFTAAKLDVARIRSKIPPDIPPENKAQLEERLGHLNEALNAGVALKRRIIEDLLPSSLINLGLQATLEIQAREFEQRTGIQTEAALDPIQTNSATSLTIFRLVQESLNNIAKYAQAQHVRITLEQNEAHIELHIADDGQGFDPQAAFGQGHGLPGMRHRVEALAGYLQIEAEGGKGCSIRAVLPIPHSASSSTYADAPVKSEPPHFEK